MTKDKNRRGESLLGFFTIVGWTATILGLGGAGLITYTQGAYALVGMVVIVVLSIAFRTSAAQLFLRIALPVVAVAVLIVREGHGDAQSMTALAGMIMALLIALFGIFVMFRGLFR